MQAFDILHGVGGEHFHKRRHAGIDVALAVHSFAEIQLLFFHHGLEQRFVKKRRIIGDARDIAEISQGRCNRNFLLGGQLDEIIIGDAAPHRVGQGRDASIDRGLGI